MAKKSFLKVKITGVDEIRKEIRARREEIKQAMDDAIRMSANEIRDDARGLAREKTGAMRRGIIVARYEHADEGVIVYDVGMDPNMTSTFRKMIKKPKGKRKDAYYPTVMEFGTSKIKARPFLRPAKDKGKRRTKLNVTKAIKAVLDK